MNHLINPIRSSDLLGFCFLALDTPWSSYLADDLRRQWMSTLSMHSFAVCGGPQSGTSLYVSVWEPNQQGHQGRNRNPTGLWSIVSRGSGGGTDWPSPLIFYSLAPSHFTRSRTFLSITRGKSWWRGEGHQERDTGLPAKLGWWMLKGLI